MLKQLTVAIVSQRYHYQIMLSILNLYSVTSKPILVHLFSDVLPFAEIAFVCVQVKVCGSPAVPFFK